MTTPYVNSSAYVIQDAMVNCGLLEEGQMPNSQQLTMYFNRLNKLINVVQVDGLRLWLQQDKSITLMQGTNQYFLNTPKPTRVLEGYYLNNDGTQRPVMQMSRNEWDTLSMRATQGQPNSFFADKQATSIIIYVWLTPDAITANNGVLHLLVQQQQTNMVTLTEDMVFPPEWFLALSWGLANEICTGQPPAIVARCQQMWAYYKDKLDSWDVEDADTMFVPDSRGAMGNRGFT